MYVCMYLIMYNEFILVLVVVIVSCQTSSSELFLDSGEFMQSSKHCTISRRKDLAPILLINNQNTSLSINILYYSCIMRAKCCHFAQAKY